MHGLMRGRWELLTAVVRGRRVRRSVREQLQVCTSALLYQKIPIPIDGRKACPILEDLCAWDVVVNEEQSVLGAIDLQAKFRLSFWDSLILEATRRSGATTLYSEDLSNGQQVRGITIVESL